MSKAINEFLQFLATEAGFAIPNKQTALNQGKCMKCGQEAHSRIYSIAGAKEYAVSGICEICFDEIFKDEE